ncbi:MAG TPA: hypothetical protein VFN57_03535 [Thermomicrobiaceae bacterium]|nr:hypothetical protein [Thermomicrobiaceae bacterium]
MTRQRRSAPTTTTGRDDRAADISLEHLDVGPGDEAVAILAEDAFEDPERARMGLLPDHTDEWAAEARARTELVVRMIAAWCVVASEHAARRSRRWRRKAGLWLNDALTVAVAWVTATAVAIVLRLQGAWGDARSRARERQVARAMARHSAAEIRATRPIPSNDEGRLNADPEIGQTTLREAALNAWGEQRGQQEARLAHEQQRRAAQDADALRRLTAQRLGVKITPSSGMVEIDGLRLGVVRGNRVGDYALVLLTACAGCGASVASGDLRDLADLGAAVDAVNERVNLCEECRRTPQGVSNAEPGSTVTTLRRGIDHDGRGAVSATYRGNGTTGRVGHDVVPGNGHVPIDGGRGQAVPRKPSGRGRQANA